MEAGHPYRKREYFPPFLFLAVLIFTSPLYSLGRNPDQVQISTHPHIPGNTLRIKLLKPSLVPFQLTWNQETVLFFPVNKNDWQALIRVPLDATPGSTNVFVHFPPLKSAEPQTKSVQIEIGPSHFGFEKIEFPADKARLLNDPSEDQESRLIRDFLAQGKNEPQKIWKGKFLSPIPGTIISPYGMTRQKVGQKENDFHRGVDLAGNRGDEIIAPNHATVLMANDLKFHGRTVLLNHGQGVGSIYIHLESINVNEGDSVKKGEKIGEVGSSGLATAPHLHWGIYVHGNAVNPVQWLEEEF